MSKVPDLEGAPEIQARERVETGRVREGAAREPKILNGVPDILGSMAHETLIFGFIRGPVLSWEKSFPLFGRNLQEIGSLSDEADYPFLARSMFTIPDPESWSVVFRSPVIHFGSSIKGIEFGDVPEWLGKFEHLLSRLYWSEVEVHFITNVMGAYRYSWKAEDSVFETYHAGNPQPTTKWQRTLFAGNEPVPKSS